MRMRSIWSENRWLLPDELQFRPSDATSTGLREIYWHAWSSGRTKDEDLNRFLSLNGVIYWTVLHRTYHTIYCHSYLSPSTVNLGSRYSHIRSDTAIKPYRLRINNAPDGFFFSPSGRVSLPNKFIRNNIYPVNQSGQNS